MNDQVRCAFCPFLFDNKIEAGIHYLAFHRFKKGKKIIDQCPLCTCKTWNIYDHVLKRHTRHCVYCAQVQSSQSDCNCEDVIEQSMEAYVQKFVLDK